MWKLRISFCISLFSLSLVAKADVCLESGNLEQLKQRYEILVLGKVVSKKPTKKILNSEELKISVIKVLNGNLNVNELKGYEIAPRNKAISKKDYKVGKEYYFPVAFVGAGKDKELEAQVQPSGCPDFMVKDK